MISVIYRIKQLAANLYRSWSESNCILTTVLESNTSRTIRSTRMFNDGLGFSPHARLNRVRERVPQRRSWILTSLAIATVCSNDGLGVSPHARLERFNEGLGVPPHSRLKLRILKKVLEFHLTYGKILFRSYLNTRSWSSTSLVAADKNRRHNNKSNCSLGCNSRCVSLKWRTLRPKLLFRQFSHIIIHSLSSFLFRVLTKC